MEYNALEVAFEKHVAACADVDHGDAVYQPVARELVQFVDTVVFNEKARFDVDAEGVVLFQWVIFSDFHLLEILKGKSGEKKGSPATGAALRVLTWQTV
jgi:hypothetical protein